MTKEKLTRSVEIEPASDRRNPDPRKNYGICSARLNFILKGRKGAVVFYVLTGWYLNHNKRALMGKGHNFLSNPVDFGRHAYSPQFPGEEKYSPCNFLDDKPCYYDGSTMQAHELFNVLVEKGHEAMWKEMEELYKTMKGRGGREA